MAQQNLTVTDDPDAAPGYARLICAHITANESPEQVLTEIEASARLDAQNAGFVLGAAAAVYCPEQLPKLPQQ